MKTYLDIEIDRAFEKYQKFTTTSIYDSGVRDVYLEGYINGLQRAKRLVSKQLREDKEKK